MRSSFSRRSLLLFWEKVSSAFVRSADEGKLTAANAPHPSPLPERERGTTIHDVVSTITTSLTNYSDAPHIDAQRIILHALNQREPSYLLAHATDAVSDQQLQEITQLAAQRKTGMPLAYILGEADFYGRTFIVTPDVLIPRPDTETLIEQALEYIKQNFAGKQEITIADICTGSGIIAITIALELEKLTAIRQNSGPAESWRASYRFIATDISPAALDIAKQNAEKHGIADRVEFLQGDMLSPIKHRHVDLIVSNPPYVPTTELNRHPGLRAGIQTRVSNVDSGSKPGMTTANRNLETRGLLFEPRIALDGGPDGQLFVNQIKASGIPAIIETTGGEIIAAT